MLKLYQSGFPRFVPSSGYYINFSKLLIFPQKNIAYKIITVKLFSGSKSIQNRAKSINDPNFRIVFLGNDNFALQNLKVITEIIHSKDNLSVVVSNANNIVGKYAQSKCLSSTLWEDFKSTSNQDNFDIGVVASFGYLIPKRVIDKCYMGILNVHGSLLPKLRGAAPISRAIINGNTETGVSVMKIAPHRFDIGPILLREKCRIHPHIRAPELTSLMATIGGQSLKKVLLNLENAVDKFDPQQDEEATLAPKLTPELGHIHWDKCTASEIYNLYRGLCGTFKTFTFYQGRKIDLDDIGLVFEGESVESNPVSSNKTQVLHEDIDFSEFYPSPVTILKNPTHSMWKDSCEPGHIFVEKNSLFVKCANNDWVFIRKVKVGAKWMSAKDFQNGFMSKYRGKQVFNSSLSPDNSNLERKMKSN